MDIRPIRADADYEAALKAVSTLMDMDPAPSTPEGGDLEILAILVEKYEAEHFPMSEPNTSDAIRFRMEQAAPLSHVDNDL